ncbi:MAG TPA: S1 RNA-binding domain-containing protein, partial [Longimicrobium sp.]
QNIQCKVIELNRSRNNVVLSRRAVLEEERKEQRQAILERLQPGLIIEGQISNIVDFGAFVDLDGIDGLIHISELSWSHVNHPSEVLSIGQTVEVKVLDIDRDRQRISLGLKQTQEDPWGDIAQQYHVGQEIAGPISRLQDKGVAVDLGNDVEGFVPVSQIGVTGLQNPADVFAEGDVLDMRISEVDAANHRIVCEVVRVPKFEGGEPQFIQLATPPAPRAAEDEGEETAVNDQITDAVEGEAPEAEAPAAAPVADEAAEVTAEAPAAEAAPSADEGSETTASAEEAPAAEASAEEPASDAAPEEEQA